MEECSTEGRKLGDHVVMSLAGTTLFFRSDVILRVSDCSKECTEFARRLREGLSKGQLATWLVDADCREIFQALEKLGFIVSAENNPWTDEPFARHFGYFAGLGLDPITAQKRLLKSHVLILGVGGIGSTILQHLVGAGVGQYTLVDHDVVEVTNLNRQFIFSRRDVGQAKVDVAAQYILARLPDAHVETRRALVSSSEELQALRLPEPITFFVNAADSGCPVIEAVASFCAERGIAFIGGGCGFRDGRYGPMVPAGAASEFIQSFRISLSRAAGLGAVNEAEQTVSYGPLNTLVAALMAQDVIEHLIGRQPCSVGHSIGLDLGPPLISKWPAHLNLGEKA